MIISEKSYVIILMIKHPTDNLDHQTKPTNTKQTSLIIKQTILKTNQPTLMFCKEQPYWFWLLRRGLRQVPCLTFPKASEEGNLTSGDSVWGKSPNLFRHFPCNAVYQHAMLETGRRLDTGLGGLSIWFSGSRP